MPAARGVLLDSATTWTVGSENRLTEILATVLASCSEFAGALFRSLGLPEGHRYGVRTQFVAAPRCHPDLEVVAYAVGGAEIARIWSEHKTVSKFREQQREDYLDALGRLPGRGELLIIAPGGLRAKDEDPGSWNWMTWPEVAEMANSTGEKAGGSGWREAALDPDSPARQRLLYELIWYLEKEHGAVMNPLSQDKIDTFAAAEEALRVLFELVERAVDGLDEVRVSGDGASEDLRSFWILFEPRDDWWLTGAVRDAGGRGHGELRVSADDDWSLEQLGKPAIGAGYTIDTGFHPVLSVEEDWIRRLESGGFSFRVADGWLRCYRTIYLDDLATRGETLGEQAGALSRWLQEVFEDLRRLPPAVAGS